MARPENLKGVLFDFDGTLADTEILGFELDQAVAAQYGIRLDEQDLRSLIGTTGLESVPAMFARHGVEITYPEFEARRQRNDVIYKERLQGLVPGAKKVLDDLVAHGIRLALVSTTDTYEIVYACNRFGITSHFDAFVGGDMDLVGKPAPDPYLTALGFLGLKPEECIVVEDSPTGIAAGKAAGMHTIAFTGGSVVQDVSAADETFASYEELSLI
ncbi:HAD family hydrolase [Olsenella sp. Marseille-QA0557]|uniref:HAD family phosphatase n=1 Tax=Candidatus Coprovicinus avistercoris TaxID=2840754 RepID=A0A9D1HY94_9ACTN|nr:HAD family phosphatase [Candidatus Coprovicinus avistercoris]